jgi:regulator of sirC expression with transglutaminase-like and TPR domain
MIEQRDALLRLLRDDDPETLGLVKDQLAQQSAAALVELRALLAGADPASARHLREVIAEIRTREADTIFANLCAEFGEYGDIEEAAWSLAAAFTPGADFQQQRDVLDAWGAEVARRLDKASSEVDRVETLVEYLAHEVRLRGNERDYYNVSNSLLPHVIESRTGIPLTLSLVYLFVGRRAGVVLNGVGLPGHFIVRRGEAFFDPFHGGRQIGLEDCRELLARQNLVLSAQHLQPATPLQILRRMLLNLFSVTRASDPALAEKLAAWIGKLRPCEV